MNVIGLSARRIAPDLTANGSRRRAMWAGDAELIAGLKAAGLAVAVLAVPDPAAAVQHAEAMAERLDALVLQGGTDIEPSRYGETPLDDTCHGDAARDAFEFALYEAFDRRDKPVLGVCRGLQVMNVARGGSLWQDLPRRGADLPLHDDSSYDAFRHAITLEPDGTLAALYGRVDALISSAHHQGVRRLADGFVVEATRPEDGLIEAFRASDRRWQLGVQWHPEFHRHESGAVLHGDRLLAAFARAVAEAGARLSANRC